MSATVRRSRASISGAQALGAVVRLHNLAIANTQSSFVIGNVAILLALRALKEAGRLDGMQITVIMTGDEESVGQPIAVARKALIDAARQSDVALAFEGGSATRVAIGRRGASLWRLTVTGTQAHSSGVWKGLSATSAGGIIVSAHTQ